MQRRDFMSQTAGFGLVFAAASLPAPLVTGSDLPVDVHRSNQQFHYGIQIFLATMVSVPGGRTISVADLVEKANPL